MRRNLLVVLFICLFIGLTVATALAQTTVPDPAKKVSVPAAGALTDATSLVNDVYGSDLAAAKTPEQKTALVTKLLGMAKDEKDSNGRFALLSKAKDIAVQAGDCDGAVAAIDGIDAEFEIDAIKMKAEAIRSITRSSRSPQQRKSVAAGAESVVRAALAADRYDIATSMAEMALGSAHAANDPESIRSAAATAEQVRSTEAAYAGVQSAMKKLAAIPTDPDANLKVGKFCCFIKGDWDKGLPMLALGRDAALKSLAARELAGSLGSEDQAKIGDGWWDIASKEMGAPKIRVQQHAGTWYTAASPNLAGLLKTKVDARLKLLSTPPPAAVEESADNGKRPRTFQNTIGMRFIEIKPGTFTMGTPADEAGHQANETLHRVIISRGFYMALTPVTQAQWKAVMGNNPSNFRGDNLPVEQVNWDDAVAYCAKLSNKEGKRYRLPTEAEWEYACRAGTHTAYNVGNDEAALSKAGWYGNDKGNADKKTHPVAQKQPNAWGLYDMHGNVWQWCSDWYGDYPTGDQRNPTGPPNGTDRVLRGESWLGDPQRCRSGVRGQSPNARSYNFGFRLVLDLN